MAENDTSIQSRELFANLERFLTAWSREKKARDPRLLREANELALSLASRGLLEPSDEETVNRLRNHLRPVLVFEEGLAQRFEELWVFFLSKTSEPDPGKNSDLPFIPREPFKRERNPGRKNYTVQVALIVAALALIAGLGWWVMKLIQTVGETAEIVDVAGPRFPLFDTIKFVGATVCVVFAFCFFWRYGVQWREAEFLTRKLGPKDPNETSHDFWLGLQRDDFNLRELINGVSSRLRQHLSISTNRLDGNATVRRTIQNGGIFVPVLADRPQTPDYLFLVEERSDQDHLGRLFLSWLNSLRDAGVSFEEFRFSGSPARATPVKNGNKDIQSVSLKDLSIRYPDHRLIVFAEKLSPLSSFCESANNHLKPWFITLREWKNERILLTPPTAWKDPLISAWRNDSWEVFDFSQSGIKNMAEWLAGENESNGTDGLRLSGRAGTMPAELIFNEDDWTGPEPPDPIRIDRLKNELRHWLGTDGWMLLKACAVFPLVNWHLTRFLFQGIRSPDKVRMDSHFQEVEADMFIKLGQLPWLRSGIMPEWLREYLLGETSQDEQEEINGLIHAALKAGAEGSGFHNIKFSASHPEKKRRMSLAVWKRLANRYHELDDELTVSGLGGKRGSTTKFRLPGGVSRRRRSWGVFFAVVACIPIFVFSFLLLNNEFRTEIWSDFTRPENLVGHIAYVLLITSMMMRSMSWLRFFAIMAGAISATYYAILADYVSMFWEALFSLVNLGQLIILKFGNRRGRFSKDKNLFIKSYLPSVGRAQAEEMMMIGAWTEVQEGVTLITEGDRPATLRFLVRGEATVERYGRVIGTAQSGDCIGEMSYLTNQPAIATVITTEPSRFIEFDQSLLREHLKDNIEVRQALEANFDSDLMEGTTRFG